MQEELYQVHKNILSNEEGRNYPWSINITCKVTQSKDLLI